MIKSYNVFNNKLLIAVVFILSILLGCKKFVDVQPPVDQIISDEVFRDDGQAISAITGIYSEMINNSGKFSAGEVTFYAGMSADELTFHPSGSIRDEFSRNQITEANHNALLTIFWEKAYKYIYTANLCLEKMAAPEADLTDSIKSRLEAECKFIRAFCYFHLVNLFGDVPLTTTPDFRINMLLPRAPVLDIYKQIIKDLIESKSALTEYYITPPDKVRPNKWTAAALLSRVYLYRNEWAKAEEEASAIINSGMYTLPRLDTVFKKFSTEAIWQLLPVNTNNNNTWEGNLLIGPGTSSFVLTDTLYRSFELNDLRKGEWTTQRTFSGGNIKNVPRKYTVKTSSAKLEYYLVFRLGEQYLIRSEARAKQNKLSESAEDLNKIRSRAGLPNTTATTQSTLVAAIEQERKIELFAEWGHRWYDLKRTERAGDVLGPQKPQWSSTDIFWPIPNSQLLSNPALIQNPGY